MKKIIYVDFDGVINSYKTKFDQNNPTLLPDPPFPGAIAWLSNLVHNFHVVIFTCRMLHGDSEAALHAWFRNHGMPNYLIDQLAFSCVKRGASVYIDDRGFRFEGIYPSVDELQNMIPWHKND